MQRAEALKGLSREHHEALVLALWGDAMATPCALKNAPCSLWHKPYSIHPR